MEVFSDKKNKSCSMHKEQNTNEVVHKISVGVWLVSIRMIFKMKLDIVLPYVGGSSVCI